MIIAHTGIFGKHCSTEYIPMSTHHINHASIPMCFPSEVCSVDCGTHGVCMGGACRCEEGWTGAGCDQRVCNPLCIKHGTCKDGKCQCHQGWNGEHCTIGKSYCVLVCEVGLGVCLSVFLLVNMWVRTKTPALTQTKVVALFHFVRRIWK